MKLLKNKFFWIFTIHFATINTKTYTATEIGNIVFTIHFATINTFNHSVTIYSYKNLQYTLLLLIRIPCA